MRTLESYRKQILIEMDKGIYKGFFNIFEAMYNPLDAYQIYLVNFPKDVLHSISTMLRACGFEIYMSTNNCTSSSPRDRRIYWSEELMTFTEHIEDLDGRSVSSTLLNVELPFGRMPGTPEE